MASLQRVKALVVGDRAVQKSALIMAFATKSSPGEYVPTAYDHNELITIDGKQVSLMIYDSSGNNPSFVS